MTRKKAPEIAAPDVGDSVSHSAFDSPDSDFAELRALAASIVDLQRQQAAALALTVQGLIDTQSRNATEIEHALDQLLDCACIPEGLALFKTLCHYYYGIDPAVATFYDHACREMWDSDADE